MNTSWRKLFPLPLEHSCLNFNHSVVCYPLRKVSSPIIPAIMFVYFVSLDIIECFYIFYTASNHHIIATLIYMSISITLYTPTLFAHAFIPVSLFTKRISFSTCSRTFFNEILKPTLENINELDTFHEMVLRMSHILLWALLYC